MNENMNMLLLEDVYQNNISVEDAKQMKKLQKDFLDSYIQNKDKMTVEEWIHTEFKLQLPSYTNTEISEIRDEIISTLKLAEANQDSLEAAIEHGRSKESWFASEIKKTSSLMSTQESVLHLQELDNALTSANTSLYDTIVTQAGVINQNPNLDGFIAEQYHAQTFNLNAEATGSPYRAKVLEPNGHGYSKNSVDIVIVDANGKVVSRYQAKYCKDAKSTLKAYQDGDYRGQQLLVPEDQSSDIKHKHTTVIEAPDGTQSKPLSKVASKDLQKEAQSGKWNDLNWNEYKNKDLAIGIGKQAGQAALMGAAIGAGFNIAQKVCTGEKIDGDEVIETALMSGADFGVKAAVAGALKVGSEKGIIKLIPKGTPASTIANIAHVSIENVKILIKMSNGELSCKEGFEKMEQTTVSIVAGIAAGTKGTALGSSLGTVLGPVGIVAGGFIGGIVGYMAGSKIGESVVKVAQKHREIALDIAITIGNTISSTASNIADSIRNFGNNLLDLFQL